MRLWIATALTASALAAGWLWLTLSGAVSDLFLPPPRELWDALLDLLQNGYKSRPFWEHIADSLIRVFAGFGLGAAVGTLLGLLMGYLPIVDALAAPFVEFLRPLPQLAYLVLLIIWLGIGETSKITLLFLAALPVSAVAARDGVRTSLRRACASRSHSAPASGRYSAMSRFPRRWPRSSPARGWRLASSMALSSPARSSPEPAASAG